MGIVYAVFKNGMWDDPAVASTGWIAEKFKSKTEEAKSPTTPYFTWRFCYLLCGTLFGLARLVIGWLTLRGVEEKYLDFIESQLPPAISLDNFHDLASFLAYEDLAVWVISVVSFILLVAALCAAAPSCARSRATLSRRLIWTSWIVAFVPQFLMFLAFPIRSLVDWEQVTADVCTNSIQTTFRMPGSEVRRNLVFSSNHNLMEDAGAIVEDPAAWCKSQGVNWHSAFYDTLVSCSWVLEDECRDRVCTGVPGITDCLSDCPAYAQSTGVAIGQLFLDRMQTCTERGTRFQFGLPPRSPDPSESMSEQIADMYRVSMFTQRQFIVNGSEAVTLASVQAEYVIGLLIAMVAARYLLTASLSLLGGLAEALMNNKAMFPGSQAAGWILIFTTAESVPVYATVLAIFQQVLGDSLLTIACVLLTLYTALGILTGQRILFLRSSDAQREVVYRRVWCEYILRVVLGVGILGALFAWDRVKGGGLMEFVKEEVLTTEVIISAVVDMLAKKIVTAVAGTDCVLSAFVQTEMWQLSATDEERQAHEKQVLGMAAVICPASNGGSEQSSAEV